MFFSNEGFADFLLSVFVFERVWHHSKIIRFWFAINLIGYGLGNFIMSFNIIINLWLTFDDLLFILCVFSQQNCNLLRKTYISFVHTVCIQNLRFLLFAQNKSLCIRKIMYSLSNFLQPADSVKQQRWLQNASQSIWISHLSFR